MTEVFEAEIEKDRVTSHDAEAHKPLTVWEDPDRLPIELVPVLDFGEKGFILKNVLSPAECRHYIEEGERVGFDGLGSYRQDYRNNLRIISMNPALAGVIFERVKAYIKPMNIRDGQESNVTAMTFGLEGDWDPLGLNETFRLCKYNTGGHFAPHFDGDFVRTMDERSMKTFMMYLNNDFEGGPTNFLNERQMLFKDPETGLYRGNAENVLLSIVPEPGMALVFNHHILHEGGQVTKGLKYILRSDVMFTRVGRTAMTPADEEALRLYQRACELEISGQAAEAVQLLSRAIKMSKRLKDQLRM